MEIKIEKECVSMEWCLNHLETIGMPCKRNWFLLFWKPKMIQVPTTKRISVFDKEQFLKIALEVKIERMQKTNEKKGFKAIETHKFIG